MQPSLQVLENILLFFIVLFSSSHLPPVVFKQWLRKVSQDETFLPNPGEDNTLVFGCRLPCGCNFLIEKSASRKISKNGNHFCDWIFVTLHSRLESDHFCRALKVVRRSWSLLMMDASFDIFRKQVLQVFAVLWKLTTSIWPEEAIHKGSYSSLYATFQLLSILAIKCVLMEFHMTIV